MLEIFTLAEGRRVLMKAAKKTGTAGRGRGKRAYHHGDLQVALIEATLALIEQRGIQGFTLKDAAAMAGVSTAAPYRHFADKEALLRAIQDEGFQRFNAALAAGYARAGTPESRIEELGVAYVRFALEYPAYIRVMFGMGGEDVQDGDKQYKDRHHDENAKGFLLLVKAVDAVHPEATLEFRNDLVAASWSIVHGFALLQMENAFAVMGDTGEVEERLRRALRRTVSKAGGAAAEA